ncbi:hypothetical protein FQN60_017807 [Etheostoma spectabile]|uniref:Uncharacterized protein n=1 Tax=Etheostoma spectabile TaxID=54343 RepID=A0A5J5DGA6_9PERO|nr:hypothetical protein FQN60_017807 [Etheostoma spectabile]
MFILLRSAVPCCVLLGLVVPTVPCYAMNINRLLQLLLFLFLLFPLLF